MNYEQTREGDEWVKGPPDLPVSDMSGRRLQTGSKVNGSCYQPRCGYNQKLSGRQMRGSLWVVCVAEGDMQGQSQGCTYAWKEKQSKWTHTETLKCALIYVFFPIIPKKIIAENNKHPCAYSQMNSLGLLQICRHVVPVAYLVGTLFWLLHDNILQAVLFAAMHEKRAAINARMQVCSRERWVWDSGPKRVWRWRMERTLSDAL